MSLSETDAAPSRSSRISALSPLGCGAANLGNMFRPLTDDEAWAILEAAWNSGIRYFDTAPHYGLGLSEIRLGAFLRTKPRDDFVLSTKAGRLLRPNGDDSGGLDLQNNFHVPTTLRREWDFSAAGVQTSLDESLHRLGLDRVDALYLHDPERFDLALALDEGLPALIAQRDTGRVDAVGVGSMVNDALSVAAESAELDLMMIAGRYTLLDTSPQERVLPAFRQRGTKAVAASVFNSGLLASETPTRAGRYEYGELPDGIWEKLQRIVGVCNNHDVPLPAAAVQFPLQNPLVESVVVGGSRPAQLAQNAAWARISIPDGLWAELRSEELIPART